MRFVILQHDSPARGLHWDLMFENEQGTLTTWALEKEPVVGAKSSAEKLPDHRADYLNYEGPISNDRGHVTQWDAGESELIEGMGDEFLFRLSGKKLRSVVVALTRDNDSWQCDLRQED